MSRRFLPLLFVCAAVVCCFQVRASWFEFCEMEGEITTSSRDRSAGIGAYAMDVRIDRAQERKFAGGSYIDCSEYIGDTLRVVLVMPRGKVPAPGDRVRFERTLIDGFDTNGDFAGTSVRNRYRALTRAKP